MQYLFTFLISIAILWACQPSKNSNGIPENGYEMSMNREFQQDEEELRQKFIGDWVWEKTICCGRTPITHTADTAKVVPELHFRDGDLVDHVRNGEVSKVTEWHLIYGLVFEDRLMLKMGEGQAALFTVTDTTLIIDYGYMDLQTEYYRRIQE